MKLNTVIVDTNVILVANNAHKDISDRCILTCIQHLHEITQTGHVVIDSGFLILREYLNKTNINKAPNVGDKFVKWLLQNAGNSARCTQIILNVHAEREFEAFPADVALQKFDPPDRKFVAVAAAHPDKPPILQAADCKWLDWEAALKNHGICVQFICGEDVKRFHSKKFGKKS